MTAHVIPNNDERMHRVSMQCWCEPRVDWDNPDTGLPWENGGPRVIHHAMDGREACEEITGEKLGPDKNWRLEVVG